ncbi:hypothetical protein F5Y15DRAFT_276472 [Xylariaceae sp. FL0016]|nr:hypothetical protein F5Y15DRAFT_276472 [Xylariaceae sp. FL0016]
MKVLTTQITASFFLASAGSGSAGSGCKFTLSSPSYFTQSAGQLDDGQIRFNGSYPPSRFCLHENGGISDDNGHGCVVTGSPTTQFQCDHGKPPNTSFSIDANNTLLYRGSTKFFVCPATDTEYNVYVSPDFGQTKCFSLTLTTSACGSTTMSLCLTEITQRLAE